MDFWRQFARRGLVALLLLSATAFAAVTDPELQSEYGNKVLTLRHFYSSPRLHFDAGGKLLGNGETDAWTIAGQFQVRDIRLSHGVIQIRGQRQLLFYDSASKTLRDAGSIPKGEAKKYFRGKSNEKVAKNSKVEIELDLGASQPTMAEITNAMNAVFLAQDEPLTNVVPDFWKSWVRGKNQPPEKDANTGDKPEKFFRVGHGVAPPHANYTPDPVYSDLARQAKYQGTLLLWLVVGADGLPEHIRVQRPLGMGLDEKAVAAVKRWKFDPATNDGAPVPVMINVEVNFRLY